MTEKYYRKLVDDIQKSVAKGDLDTCFHKFKDYIPKNFENREMNRKYQEIISLEGSHSRTVDNKRQMLIGYPEYNHELRLITNSIIEFLETLRPEITEVNLNDEFEGEELDTSAWDYDDNFVAILKYTPDFGLLEKGFEKFVLEKKDLDEVRYNMYYVDENGEILLEETQFNTLKEDEQRLVVKKFLYSKDAVIFQKREKQSIVAEALVSFKTSREEIITRVYSQNPQKKIEILLDVINWFKKNLNYPENLKEPFVVHIPFNSLSIFENLSFQVENNQNLNFNLLIQKCQTEITDSDNIEECFRTLLDVFPDNKELRSNSGALKNLNGENRLGTIPKEEYRIERNRIRIALLDFLGEMYNVNYSLKSSQTVSKSNSSNTPQLISKPKTITIFLASSSELLEDRIEFEIFINRENKRLNKEGIFLNLELWEDFIDAMSKTRLQDEYNKVVKESDIFVSLYFTKVGKYTEEEFETAYKQFKKNGKPFVYTYFKHAEVNIGSLTNDIISLLNFKEKLQNLEHFFTEYKNIQDLKLHFKGQLEKILSSL